MSKLLLAPTVILACCLMAACSVTDSKAPIERSAAAKSQHPNNRHHVKDELYSQYQQWKGTKYKMGGLGKGGVDCSGFVYLTYLQKFGVKLPRSTRQQSLIGSEVPINELRPGDLVFFKTASKVRHVGIYIDNKAFLHASTKKGVMISHLDDYYWKDKYWHARRVE